MKKIINIIALIILLIFIFTANTYCVDDPTVYNPTPTVEKGTFLTGAEKILGWIRYIGEASGIIVMACLGIKYMLGSIEEKADYKRTMWPYVIGVFMLEATCVVIGIIEGIAAD